MANPIVSNSRQMIQQRVAFLDQEVLTKLERAEKNSTLWKKTLIQGLVVALLVGAVGAALLVTPRFLTDFNLQPLNISGWIVIGIEVPVLGVTLFLVTSKRSRFKAALEAEKKLSTSTLSSEFHDFVARNRAKLAHTALVGFKISDTDDYFFTNGNQWMHNSLDHVRSNATFFGNQYTVDKLQLVDAQAFIESVTSSYQYVD